MIDHNNHPSEDQIQAYFDGELDSAQTSLIRDHLAECAACQGIVTRLKSLDGRLDELPEISLSRDLSNLVVSQLRAERSLSPGITWTLIIEALAAGIVIGLLIPAFQAAGWLPDLLYTRQELAAALNIFLTQLASSWLVWLAGLRLQIIHLIQNFLPATSQPLIPFSPWILVGAAGGVGILVNYLLLGRQTVPGRNHQKH